jgi:hypothetical protein
MVLKGLLADMGLGLWRRLFGMGYAMYGYRSKTIVIFLDRYPVDPDGKPEIHYVLQGLFHEYGHAIYPNFTEEQVDEFVGIMMSPKEDDKHISSWTTEDE